MKTEILRILRESDGYVSGQQLCEHLGVSRTAIWKSVNQLKEEGYMVEAVRNKGYCIMESPDIITEAELMSRMDTTWAGQEIYCFDEIDSTNIRAKQLGEAAAPHGTLIVADHQSAGRGRRGRGWESPAGSSVYMSLLLRPLMPPAQAPMLTLVMALSVAKGLQQCTGIDVQIKWPNDIVLNGKKIVGILTEMSAEIDFINHVVVGVGINVNTTYFPEDIAEKATSLRIECGRQLQRSDLIVATMRQFETYYEQFQNTFNMKCLQDEYNELLVNRNQEVCVLGEQEEYRAFALGINESGELIVRRRDGTNEAVFAGEVSVRGVYGYA